MNRLDSTQEGNFSDFVITSRLLLYKIVPLFSLQFFFFFSFPSFFSIQACSAQQAMSWTFIFGSCEKEGVNFPNGCRLLNLPVIIRFPSPFTGFHLFVCLFVWGFFLLFCYWRLFSCLFSLKWQVLFIFFTTFYFYLFSVYLFCSR